MKFSSYLTICLLMCTLFLTAACSSQNPIVNPSPVTWRIVHGQNPDSAKNSLGSVAATFSNDTWAVGSFSNNHLITHAAKAMIEHWNGSAWSVVSSPATPLEGSDLSGVAAISPTDAWAVGNAYSNNDNELQTLIEHWDGTSWAIVKSLSPTNGAQLFALTALSATDIWAVGIYGNNLGRTLSAHTLIEHWNGTAWTVVQSPNAASGLNYLESITAVSANDIWAAGFSSGGQTVLGMQKTLIEHWNGTSWSSVVGQNPGKESNYLSAIVGRSPHDIWAVGSFSSSLNSQQAQSLIEHWNGAAWSTVASPNIGTNNTSLVGIGLVPYSTHIWAVGQEQPMVQRSMCLLLMRLRRHM